MATRTATTTLLYKSTRGGDAGSTFEDVLKAAYCSDGGLFVPDGEPLSILALLGAHPPPHPCTSHHIKPLHRHPTSSVSTAAEVTVVV
jgi:Threonine synthase N terminus